MNFYVCLHLVYTLKILPKMTKDHCYVYFTYTLRILFDYLDIYVDNTEKTDNLSKKGLKANASKISFKFLL